MKLPFSKKLPASKKMPVRLSLAELQIAARDPKAARELRKEREVIRSGLDNYTRAVDTMNRRAEERMRAAAECRAYCEAFIHDIDIALGQVEA